MLLELLECLHGVLPFELVARFGRDLVRTDVHSGTHMGLGWIILRLFRNRTANLDEAVERVSRQVSAALMDYSATARRDYG